MVLAQDIGVRNLTLYAINLFKKLQYYSEDTFNFEKYLISWIENLKCTQNDTETKIITKKE